MMTNGESTSSCAVLSTATATSPLPFFVYPEWNRPPLPGPVWRLSPIDAASGVLLDPSTSLVSRVESIGCPFCKKLSTFYPPHNRRRPGTGVSLCTAGNRVPQRSGAVAGQPGGFRRTHHKHPRCPQHNDAFSSKFD